MPSTIRNYVDAISGKAALPALMEAISVYIHGGCNRQYGRALLAISKSSTVRDICNQLVSLYADRPDPNTSFARLVYTLAACTSGELKAAMEAAQRTESTTIICDQSGRRYRAELPSSTSAVASAPERAAAYPGAAAAGAGAAPHADFYPSMSFDSPSESLQAALKKLSAAMDVASLKAALPESISARVIKSATDLDTAVRRVFEHVYNNLYPVYIPDRRPQFQEVVPLPLQFKASGRLVQHVHEGGHDDSGDDSDEDHEPGTYKQGAITFVDAAVSVAQRLSFKRGETYRCKSGELKTHGLATYQVGSESREVPLAAHDCYFKLKNTDGGGIYVIRHLQGFTEEGGVVKRLKDNESKVRNDGRFTYARFNNGIRLHHGLLQHHALQAPLSLSSEALKSAYLLLSDSGVVGRLAQSHASRLGFERVLYREGHRLLSCRVGVVGSDPMPPSRSSLALGGPSAGVPSAPPKPVVREHFRDEDPSVA